MGVGWSNGLIECLSVERLAPFGLVVTVDSHSLRGEGSLPTGFSRDLLGLFPDLLGFILIIFFCRVEGGKGFTVLKKGFLWGIYFNFPAIVWRIFFAINSQISFFGEGFIVLKGIFVGIVRNLLLKFVGFTQFSWNFSGFIVEFCRDIWSYSIRVWSFLLSFGIAR